MQRVQCPAKIIFGGQKSKVGINFIEVQDVVETGALERAGLLWAGQGWAGVSHSTGQQVGRFTSGFQ